jgi:hypothetical protein
MRSAPSSIGCGRFTSSQMWHAFTRDRVMAALDRAFGPQKLC